jgi:hypothetical protein
VTGSSPPPPGAGTPAAEPVAKPRNRRLRLWLALGAGVLTLLCLGGIGIAVLVYDDETKIDRAEPDQVTSSFLRTYLVNRSDDEATLYICASGAKLDQIAALRAENVNREAQFGTKVSVEWESLVVAPTSGGATVVDVDLVITGSKNGTQTSSRTEPWSFQLTDEDGWRVCGATKKT